MKSSIPTLEMTEDSGHLTLVFKGQWRVLALSQIHQALKSISLPAQISYVVLNFEKLTFLDTAGAYYLLQFIRRLEDRKIFPEMVHASPSLLSTLEIVKEFEPDLIPPPRKKSCWYSFLYKLGKTTLQRGHSLREALDFLGRVTVALVKTFVRPKNLRFVSLVDLMHKVGASALPIVGLISFLIGIVLVYQGADQLKRFGAEIFTINLLAVSALRELGILLTAIVVAGRSGSAYTAQIGFMKLNQEIDALYMLGFDPIKILVVPRMLALIIVLPLLTFFSDIMALVGGGITTYFLLGIDAQDFCHHLLLTIKQWTFWSGMIKAPVFAYFIALTACFEGFRVSGGAESVGQRTTQSVVESIFLVLIMDAMFSILFSMLRI